MSGEVERLTEAAARGERAAIDALVERYLPALRAFVRLRAGGLRQRESSSDLVQSTCREVLEHAGRFRFASEAGFKRWLFATALRKIGDRQRRYLAQKRSVRREERQPQTTALEVLACYQTFCTPSRQAIAREELARIEDAFDQLPEDQREVIALAKVVGLSRTEIATQMGRSEGAVRVLLHRALVRLAAVLAGE